MDPSSSQAEAGGFDLYDNFFGDDGLDLGGGLDDLARELGEGWGGSPMKIGQEFVNSTVLFYEGVLMDLALISNMDLDLPLDLGLDDMDMGMDMGMDFDMGADMGDGLQDPADTPRNTPRPKRKVTGFMSIYAFDLYSSSFVRRPILIPIKVFNLLGRFTDLLTYITIPENRPPSSYQGSQMTPRPAVSPATSFSRLLLSQDEEFPQPLLDITPGDQNQININKPAKKVKRTRLLLDARTELTDDELKVKLSTLPIFFCCWLTVNLYRRLVRNT